MQLSIMNKVKSGELSIEDALNQARRDQKQLLDQKNQAEEVFWKKGCPLKFSTWEMILSYGFSPFPVEKYVK